MGHVDESPLGGVAVQLHGISLPRQSEVGSHPLAIGKVIASYEQVEVAVVVVIEKPGWETPLWFFDAELGRDFCKGSISPVMIEKVVLSIVRDVEVWVA